MLVVGPTAPIIIFVYGCIIIVAVSKIFKDLPSTYPGSGLLFTNGSCAGAGAYAFENVRTSVEHGCRHVGLPERRGLERSKKGGLDW